VIRSLAQINIDVVSVIWDWPGSPSFYSDQSRHLGRSVRIANPGREPELARNDIRTLLTDLNREYGAPPLLMPTSDSILNFLLGSPSLWPLGRLANAWDFETTAHLLDKYHLSQKIISTSIHQPTTLRCTKEVSQAMALPFVVKPALKDATNSFYAEFSGAKALFIRSEAERKALVDSDLYQRYPLIAQEYINPMERIDDMPVYLATDIAGNIIHCASVDKVFVHPTGFGTAYIVREQVTHRVTGQALQEFVDCTELRGMVMLEFIRDAGNDFRFIEANPRPWLLVDYQRLRGRNYFHFLDPNTPVHLDEQITASTYYIELTGLCKSVAHVNGTSARESIITLLDSLDGPKRLSTFDTDDLGPMEFELSMLGSRYGKPFMQDVMAALND
jgi:predicted ATP-grasp superfamily ATP-dependent carboligase